MGARGIADAAVYVPHRRLDLRSVAAVAGGGGGKGTRAVAGYDEDTTTMGVEACRRLRRLADASPSTLWFSTTAPAYADKTNATAIHAALRLAAHSAAFDVVGSVRSSVGAIVAALSGDGVQLVASADLRTGLPGGPDEASFGDGAAALLLGGDDDGPLLADLVGTGRATEEFLDRWRVPGEPRSKVWEERFGETRYVPLGVAAWEDALEHADLTADQVDLVVVAGTHSRAVGAVGKRLGVADRLVGTDLTAAVGNLGAAQPIALLTSALERAEPGQVIALVVLADGADVLLFRATDAVAGWSPAPSTTELQEGGAPVDYGTYLRWRGLLSVEPPRRPEPSRPSASAAGRSRDWKFGFVGSADEAGQVHLPPQPGDASNVPMSDACGTVATFTVDRLAYSPSPPVVFAVVDFDEGGRLPVELTDVDLDQVRIGARVQPTFRRLFTADGVHNYFWKARVL
ncbi:MAG: OB-fold domain-containing protein [Acidimicrobiales bacterium]